MLLYGSLGCGKTLVTKIIFNEAGANFIVVKVSLIELPIKGSFL